LYKEVAEGRRKARTLQGEGAKLAALLNATGNAVVTVDTDGHVDSLNRAAEAMFGVESSEAFGWQMRRLVSTDAGVGDGEAAMSFGESIGRRKDGVEFPIEVSRASWIDAQGRMASGAIVRDITERRNAEAELRRRDIAERAREKLAALGRVAGGVAHELNNLLQPVIGLTQLELSQPCDGTPEQLDSRENLETILDCGNQMRDVVRKILLFARKAVPDLTPVDFPAAMRRIQPVLRKSLPPEIDIDQFGDPALQGVATINEAELLEVLSNLASNAADAMDGRGTLSIRTESIELATDQASPLGLTPGAYFRIAVADTGRGMDAAIKAQMFEPFFTTKPVGEGTGLGLSMVYGVLRNWNGAVSIDSSVGAGTTVNLYIPATPERKTDGAHSLD
jgi:PAS domain S-box-containing protein